MASIKKQSPARPKSKESTSMFRNTSLIWASAILLRLSMLLWGVFQDQYSPVKYTDIDYYVFTDAARFVARGESPYARDTYRYTPLLAWIVLPTTWGGPFFAFGKVLFAGADLLAGYFIVLILRNTYGMSSDRALKYASIWLLNPMVANISTRGSSESLLAVLATGLLWAVFEGRIVLASVVLGFAVHFKIYPFIYAASVFWYLGSYKLGSVGFAAQIKDLFNSRRMVLAAGSMGVFMGLNFLMYKIYGQEFVEHTFSYHLIRIDHRHNFSPYSTVLYLNSSPAAQSAVRFESLAFLPQLLTSAVLLPLAFAKQDLATTFLAQTFAFVTFNKVCTSQYFLWYLIFLPFYLPNSTLIRQPAVGVLALIAWIAGQATWLQQGYYLEFLGKSTFVPGLWIASLLFFVTNIWILGMIIVDLRKASTHSLATTSKPDSKR